MRKIFSLLFVGISVAGFSSAHAIDSAEQVIMKCRVNALSVEDQVACLEEALRARSPNEPKPNWSGITESGTMPEQSGTFSSSSGGSVSYPGRPGGIGSEQVKLPDSQYQRGALAQISEQSVLADFAYNSNSRLILVLSNGQVWKQRDGDTRQVNLKKGDRPRVIVRKGKVSGYRMTFPDLNREITVSRLQ